jgi:MOSC domain-containing protein YiiM
MAPSAEGVVDGLYVAEEAGAPMKELRQAELLANRGVIGDRYCRRAGTFSVFRVSAKAPGRREPGRQITLVSAEGIEAAFVTHGIKAPDSLGDLRRNVVVRGISAEALQGAVGHVIRLGDECVVFAHRACLPCEYAERRMGRAGFAEACWGVGGLCCEVVTGGVLRTGARVQIEPEEDLERVDAGEQAPGFYTRPRERKKAEKAAAARYDAARLPRLLDIDPGGVATALESYQSVGLRLFQRPKRFRRADALQERFGTMVLIFMFLVAGLLGMQHSKEWWDKGGGGLLDIWKRLTGT